MYRVIALIKAQVCDKYIYIHIYIYTLVQYKKLYTENRITYPKHCVHHFP